MKISIFLNQKIETFILPSEINGVFNFDFNENEEIKLINIKAKNGKWVLYQTSDVTIFDNIGQKEEIELKEFCFYRIRRNNITFVIYVVPALEKMDCYCYKEVLNMIIGTTEKCTIKYSIKDIISFEFKIMVQDNLVVIDNPNKTLIYVNEVSMLSNRYVMNIGDEINIFGLRIKFLNGLVFISRNPKVVIDEKNAILGKYEFPKEITPENIEITDEELYQPSDYYSKTPRFRRIVEDKEIKLSPPPGNGDNQEMPLILTIGPMLTMGIMSAVMLTNAIMRINSGETTLAKSWPSLVTSGAMLATMLVWPLVTRMYQKHIQKKRKEEIKVKYTAYLEEKDKELQIEANEQRAIMLENLVPIETCINYIKTKKIGLWDKRNDQNDFLVVRIGMGKAPLSIKVSYQEEDFTIDENELRKKADELAEKYKYVENTPVSYSFAENITTAIMGDRNKVVHFTNNIILQLMTFYTYEDVKFVVFTSKEKEHNWHYLKYLNHTFSNDKGFRFFATDPSSAKQVGDYLQQMINMRSNTKTNKKKGYERPYFFIITDDFDLIKQHDFVDALTESEENIGFSLLILEERLSKLPSKCNNFITLGQTNSGVLRNSYENQEKLEFTDEIKYNIDYLSLAKELANIPIEFEESLGNIPDSISFLEMEHVGKIEQLNISNRWKSNDSTNSLKAEIGVDEHNDLMYLDIHEKFHGPHGLIAGTTGSGKSEFIITYVLSMCVNYSPDDVSFILIDYKGGGLALAFENRTTGISLPHLAGTITNLDKAEMDRTLVSIDSEAKRRQALFNKARDELGESTMDIYKYQRFYHEGRLTEPISHLMIICDEFAELKAQQPEFMDSLISTARIGRSLGVHLILATQKPSGVVNDQIWSNTKFRVCLKVQDEADSKEMLKKPDAAHITQAGRYYLQVGYDEYFALGQSGYCGAKYYPSDKIIKEVDKSINFINDCGNFIKSIKAGTATKAKAEGEQLLNILNYIIDTAKKENKFSRRLWLDNIPEIILEDGIRKKYNIEETPYHVKAVIGEYDAPEKQEQGVVVYDFEENNNTIIYGNDGSENDQLLRAILYSSCKYHTAEEVNFYIIDFGSESLRIFNDYPQVGGMVFQGEEERFNNLYKLLNNETQRRKKLFANYGGEYQRYLKANENNKLPLIVTIFNNFDSIYAANQNLYETFPDLTRDSERYGIIYILTGSAINSIFSRARNNFNNFYAFKLKDQSDYMAVFNTRTKLVPRDNIGRGLILTDIVHEFQTVSITENQDEVNDAILELGKEQKEKNSTIAQRIPVLPDHVTIDIISKYINNLTNIPVGISKNELDTMTYNFIQDTGTIITSIKLANTKNFVLSLINVFMKIPNNMIMIFDITKYLGLPLATPNYYTDNIEQVLDKLIEYMERLIETKSTQQGIIIIGGLSKFISKLPDTKKLEIFLKQLKKYEHIGIIVTDDAPKLKQYAFEGWYTSTFSNASGFWIGRGISDQNILKVSTVNKEMSKNYKNDMGFLVQDNMATLTKWLDFYSKEGDEDAE